MKDVVIIEVYQGLISDIRKPKNIKVIIRDYDIEYMDEDSDFKKDEDGNEYIESEWL